MASATVTGTVVPAAIAEAASVDIVAGVHRGMQVYASVDGVAIAEFGVGEARAGLAMDSDTPVPWLSATKPLLAVAIGLLHQADRLDFRDRVSDFVPEYAGGGKADVRIAHLLTHAVPYARDVDVMCLQSWDAAVADACALPLRPNVEVGRSVRYTAFASWQVLGELVQRVTGEPVADHVRTAVMDPLGMGESRLFGETRAGIDVWREEQQSELSDRRPGRAGLLGLAYAALRSDVALPGVGGGGPMRDLARLYEALVSDSQKRASIGLDESVIAEMTRPHRVGLHDPFYGARVDWGLGFITDRRLFVGARLSRRVFGHDGRLCAVAFADPETRVVVCVMANALVDARTNSRRFRRVVDSTLDVAGVPRGRYRADGAASPAG